MKHQFSETLNIFIDGAARGNPGPSGIGVVIRDNFGNTVKELAKYIGEATNNAAEYTALVSALEEARDMGSRDIVINTDSELLAKQLGGEYKVKQQTLKNLYSKACEILGNFDDVRINQIPRDENIEADKLANKAIDASEKKKKVGKSFVLKSSTKAQDSLF